MFFPMIKGNYKATEKSFHYVKYAFIIGNVAFYLLSIDSSYELLSTSSYQRTNI